MEYFDVRQFINLAGGLGLINSPELKNFKNGQLSKESENWNPCLEHIFKFAIEDAKLPPALVLAAMYSGLPQKAKAKVSTLEENGRTYKFYSVDENWKNYTVKAILDRCSTEEQRFCMKRALFDDKILPTAADIRKCFYIHRSLTEGLGNFSTGYGTVAKKAGRSREAYCHFENWKLNKYSYPRVGSINLYMESCGEYHPLDLIIDIFFYMDKTDSEIHALAEENKRTLAGKKKL